MRIILSMKYLHCNLGDTLWIKLSRDEEIRGDNEYKSIPKSTPKIINKDKTVLIKHKTIRY